MWKGKRGKDKSKDERRKVRKDGNCCSEKQILQTFCVVVGISTYFFELLK